MSSVETHLIQDDRLLTTDKVKYAVLKGSANNTVVKYGALSGFVAGNAQANDSPSSLVWNIQVPSQEVVIDRRAMIKHTVNFLYRKAVDGNGVDEYIWNAGGNTSADLAVPRTDCGSCDCLNAFPVSQMVQTVQATINNTTVALNVQDTLNPILRFHDSRELSEYMGLCPYLVDRVGLYNNAQASSSSFQGPQTQILDEAFLPRSAFPVKILGDNDCPADGKEQEVNVQVEVWEPLLVSPFIWANPKVNCQGIYGIQNIAITMNFGGQNSIKRFARHLSQKANGSSVSYAEVVGLRINKSELYLNYLTPQPSSVMVPRNVVPYYELPRYYLEQNISIDAATEVVVGSNTLVKKRADVANANNLQLNQIPDKLIICFEPTQVGDIVNTNYNTNASVADFYAVIDKLTINFNNQSGLLSTWTQKDLYHASRDAGSKQSWTEFSGQIEAPLLTQDRICDNGSLAPLGFGPGNLPTTGSIVILQFGKDIELPDYYAPGSIGNFNLQIQASVSHYQPMDVNYRLLCITVNSGVFVSEKGTSNPYTALLRKEDVLNASSMEPMGCREFNRMVGGGFFDTLKSVGSSFWKVAKPFAKALAPVVSDMLGKSENPYAKMASKGINVASSLMGDGMGAGMGAGSERLARHSRGSGYGY